MKTYSDMYLDLRRSLKAAGIEDYNLEAKLLICAASSKSKEELMRDMKLFAFEPLEDKVNEMAKRRIGGEPIAYVLGEWDFMGLTFNVDPRVLIPRADTETLCELAIRLMQRRGADGMRVLDLCCGTGCIGITVAKTVQSCRVVLVDNSMPALRIARSNVLRCGVSRNTTCIEADALKNPPVLLGKYDVIVCNPPYVATGEIDTLDRGVRDFEPREALDGGADGMDFYRAIIPAWKTILKPAGLMMFECGEGQNKAIEELFLKNGFGSVGSFPDMAGTLRVVAGVMGQ